jgi:hypothetical protein
MAYEFDLGDIEGPYADSDGSQVVEFVLGVDPEADTVVVMIGASVIVCGYIVEDSFGDDASGIHYWLFRKRD